MSLVPRLSVMKTLNLIALTLLFSSFARAGSEAALWVPWSVFEKKLNVHLGGPGPLWRETLPDQRLPQGDFELQLSGLRLELQSAFEPMKVSDQGLVVKSKKTSIRLTVGGLAVDQMIEREFNGVNVRIRLQASCSPFRLIQENASAEAHLKFLWTESQPTTEIDFFTMDWPEGSWSVTDLQCEGPQGFGELLKNELQQKLREAEAFTPLIEPLLSQKIRETGGQVLSSILQERFFQVSEFSRLKVRIQNFEPQPRGLLVKALLSTGTTSTAPSWKPSQRVLDEAPAAEPSLHIPENGLSQLLSEDLSSRPSWTQFDLTQFDSFMGLLKSRFLQFFLWPDLWNYSKSSPFHLLVQTPKKVDLKWDAQGVTRYDEPFVAWVRSLRNKQWWNYVGLQGQSRNEIHLRLEGQNLVVSSQSRVENLKTQFGSDYKKTFPSTGWLASSALKKVAEGQGFKLSESWSLPLVDLGEEGGRYQASKIRFHRDGVLSVDLKTVP